MTDEKNEKTDAEAPPVTEEAKPKPARKPRAAKPKAEAAAATATTKSAEPAAEDKPKPARKPRAARPKPEVATPEAVAETAADVEAEAATDEVVEAEDEVVAATDAPAEKPKRTRTAKPKAEAAKAEKPAKAAPKKAEPKKPALRSRAARREHQEPVAAPVVRAQAKYVRSSARKARLVCDNIRGKSVDDARAILAHTPRAVARDWSKLLESAVANAEHNHELVGEDLVIKAVTADEGPTIKRFRPRAMGRATKIRKRTAHLTILLTPKN
jgi:ribosomal protein L22